MSSYDEEVISMVEEIPTRHRILAQKDSKRLKKYSIFIITSLILISLLIIVLQHRSHSNSTNSTEQHSLQIELNEVQNEKMISEKPLQVNPSVASKDLVFYSNFTMDDILKNPYNDDNHTYISNAQITQAKTLKDILSHSPEVVDQLSLGQKQYYNLKYHIDNYKQLPFCIVVPTFNNKLKKRHIRNIKSIFMQDYTKYRVIVIDDASIDGTGKEIQEYLKQQYRQDIQYKLIINKERKYALSNVRSAAKTFCHSEEIMMVVDGDDEIIGRLAIKLFNAIFQDKQAWLVYSNSLTSDGKIGYSRPYHPSIISKNSYRKYTFTVSHLRAYYTWLFLAVKDEDLQDEQGNFLQAAGDMASCVPMLELAHHKVAYIPEIVYFYNMHTGLNIHKDRLDEQRRNNLYIRTKKEYEPLKFHL